MHGARVGSYELGPCLGRGSMGSVYRVLHLELGVERALKRLEGAPDERRRRRFEREASSLAQVHHPGVVAVREFGELPDGALYYVMDLVPGESLRSLLERGRLPLPRALEIARDLCEAAQALHSVGLVHRDLKPANVVLAADGRPVILDLGLVIDPERHERLTRTGAMVGTLATMAPEQLGGAPPSPATDVFALGRILHELVTGQPAIAPGTTSVEAMGQIAQGVFSLPREVDPRLPRDLDRIVARACAREQEARYPSAAALGAALAAADLAPSPPPQRRAALALALSLAAGAALALGLLLRVDESAPRPDPSPGSSAHPAGSPASGRPGAPSPRQELAAIAQLTDPRRRAIALERWLLAHPHSPALPRAQALQRETWRAAPAKIWALPQLGLAGEVRASHASEDELWLLDAGLGRLSGLAAGELRYERSFAGAIRGLSSDGGRPLVADSTSLRALGPAGPLQALPRPRALSWAASPGGERVALIYPDGSLVVCERAGAALGPPHPLRAAPAGPDPEQAGFARVAFLDREHLLYAATLDEVNGSGLEVWRLPSDLSDARRVWLANFPGAPWGFALDPERRRFALGTSFVALHVLSIDPAGARVRLAGERAAKTPGADFLRADGLPAHMGWLRGVSFSPGGDHLYSVAALSSGGELVCWDAQQGLRLRRAALPAPPLAMTRSPDGRWLYVLCAGALEVWATETGP